MTALAVVLTLVAGLAGAVQVAVMGRFGERIGTLPALAVAAIVAAAIALAALLVARRSLAGFGDAARQPPWMWLGGVAGALIVFGLDRIPLAGTRIAGLALLAVGAGLTLHRS